VAKCISALLKHHESTKSADILDINDDLVYIEVIVSQVPSSYSIRPHQIRLPHPIYSSKYQSQFCVFSSDPQRTFKDKIQDMNLSCLAKVVGHEKLFKKYPTYADKRALANDYDLFFADHTVYSLLNKLYGKAFYQRKKIPFAINCNQVPIDLKEQFGTDYEAYLNDLANHTYFSQGNGPVYTFKVGRVDMTPQ
jgi:ribosome biogenesis protein UTP30